MALLENVQLCSWAASPSAELEQRAISALEEGKALYLPNLSFDLSEEEQALLSPQIVDPKSKNIRFDLRTGELGGSSLQGAEAVLLKEMVERFARCATQLMVALFPQYKPHLSPARTSFRPVEVLGRPSSYRKDDTRLHVDAFPSAPVSGRRILRLFSNVNLEGKPRVWRLGEPFPEVAQRFLPRIAPPLPGFATLLKSLRITKGYRTLYDHYMLNLHDQMKGDSRYQQEAEQEEIHFPPGSSWIVYSDQVSHAAMSGQHLLEQTFYLPPTAMRDPETTPLQILEKLLRRPLV